MINPAMTASLLTGPTGCGKSTLAKLICELAHRPRNCSPPAIAWKDTSKCIEDSRNLRSSVGLKLIKSGSEQAQNAGAILDAPEVFESIRENIELFPDLHFLSHFMLVGSPRTPEESSLFYGGKLRFRVIFIECTHEGVHEGIRDRLHRARKNGDKPRPDDNPENIDAIVARKWKEYEEKVLPAISLLESKPGKIVLRISRDMPLIERITATIQHMLISSKMKNDCLRKLANPKHPIHRHISDIETPAAHHAYQAARSDGFTESSLRLSGRTALPVCV